MKVGDGFRNNRADSLAPDWVWGLCLSEVSNAYS